MYEVLGLVYAEFLELFNGTDVFHMGGDEVNMNCYNSSQEIRDYLERENKVGTEDDILELWRSFQRRAFRLVAEANQGERMPAILWTNTMTEKGAEKFLTKDDYIIQIWTTGEDHSIADVINKQFKTIFSNYDAWYLDCGYAGWVTDGNNWCAPYKGELKLSLVSMQTMKAWFLHCLPWPCLRTQVITLDKSTSYLLSELTKAQSLATKLLKQKPRL